MAKEQKQKTPEQEAKEREEARAINVKKTLESKFLQNSVGTNLIKSNPYLYTGELGYQSATSLYDQTMASDDSKKIKEDLYNKRLEQGRELGVADAPSPTSNYDVSVYAMQQINEVLQIARLGELEKTVSGLGVKLPFQVGELSDYLTTDLIKKGLDESGKFDIKKLNEKEQDALAMHHTLSEYYKRACALNASKANYFSDLDAQGKKIADKYKKEEAKPSK